MRVQRKPFSSVVLLLLATSFGHVTNFAFQMIMGRMLGKDRFGEYSVMNTMLSIFALFAVPMTAVQLAIARQIAILNEKGDADSIAAILFRSVRRMTIMCLVLVGGILALAPWLKEYLHLAQYGPIFATAGFAIVAFILPIGTGALQGLQRFGGLSIASVGGPIARILVGAFFVWAGYQASGALLGTVAGNLVSFLLCLPFLWTYFRRPVDFRHIDTTDVYRYLRPAFLSLVCYAVLVNLDMVIVRHYFMPHVADQYAAASLFGRAIGWVINPLCMVLFTHVWNESLHETNRALLKQFLLGAIVLGVFIACVCTAGSALLTRLLLGTVDPEVTALIPFCVWSMLPLAIGNVFLNFVMAQGKYGFLILFVSLSLLYFVGFGLYHDTVYHVLVVVAVFGAITLGLFVAVIYGNQYPKRV